MSQEKKSAEKEESKQDTKPVAPAEKGSVATQNASRNTVNSGKKNTAPKTGDENDAVLWMGILMVASLGLLYKENASAAEWVQQCSLRNNQKTRKPLE